MAAKRRAVGSKVVEVYQHPEVDRMVSDSEHGQTAVKVIDQRSDDSLVIKGLKEAN